MLQHHDSGAGSVRWGMQAAVEEVNALTRNVEAHKVRFKRRGSRGSALEVGRVEVERWMDDVGHMAAHLWGQQALPHALRQSTMLILSTM
jgi:hypothetical protein